MSIQENTDYVGGNSRLWRDLLNLSRDSRYKALRYHLNKRREEYLNRLRVEEHPTQIYRLQGKLSTIDEITLLEDRAASEIKREELRASRKGKLPIKP